jgi:SAM-dependent methyltransferase
VYPRNFENNLSTIFEKFKTDKGGNGINVHHNYHLAYELIFAPHRMQVRNVLEIGIGTTNPKIKSSMGPSGVPGASLRSWREYFPNANISGADIDPEILFNEERIDCHFTNQESEKHLQELSMKFERANTKFDVVIDDGLHTLDAAVKTFNEFKRLVTPGGIYVIEDVPIRKWKAYSNKIDVSDFGCYYLRLTNPKTNRFSGDNFLIFLYKHYEKFSE